MLIVGINNTPITNPKSQIFLISYVYIILKKNLLTLYLLMKLADRGLYIFIKRQTKVFSFK